MWACVCDTLTGAGGHNVNVGCVGCMLEKLSVTGLNVMLLGIGTGDRWLARAGTLLG